MAANDPLSRFDTLTDRQKEVLHWVCQGLPYREIGEILFISEATVKSHMGNIYVKLGLSDLPPINRTATLFEVYCALLEKRPPSEAVEPEEPEPVPPEIEKMVEEDEKALMLWEPAPIIDAQFREVPRRRIGGGLVAGLMTLVGGGFPGASELEPPTTTTQLEESMDAVSDFTDTPETTFTPVVTATSPPATDTPAFTDTPPPTRTSTPSPTPEPDTPSGSILEVGEWWKEDGVWMRVSDYWIRPEGDIKIVIEFWNRTNGTLIFSWHPSGNFSLVDNSGHRYPLYFTYESGNTMNEVIEAGELVLIRFHQYETALHYRDKYVFNSSVTELILTVTGFSRIDEAEFRIPINK